VALEGSRVDGHRFIPEAIKRGAAAVAGWRRLAALPVPYLRVAEGREALAQLAAAFYGYPARRLTVIGVTGTDGKTTTTNLIYEILRAAGLKTGLISTVNAVIGEQVLDTGFHVTTPEAPDVQRYLHQMVSAGLTHVVLEATSHGLAQERVGACEFDIGVVTNIQHEHLDYHGSFDAYRAAKARLFTHLAKTVSKASGNPRLAVLNHDDASFPYLQEVIARENEGMGEGAFVRTVSYGLTPQADVFATEPESTTWGLRFEAAGPEFRLLESSLVGRYNVANILAALTATITGLGISPEAARYGIKNLAGIPGRMERLDLGTEFLTVVDFAHTPNALRETLLTARDIQARRATGGRVIAIFGSAGLRDRAKRRLMAEIGAELADLIVLTAEDPRTESLDSILAEMAAGATARGSVEGRTFWRVPDRGEAIRLGISLAQPGDMVLALGKGHEQSMCFGATEYPWDDRLAMRAAVAEYLGVSGPEMPYLPTQDAGGS